MINCEIELDFRRTKDLVLTECHNNITGKNFTSTKLYVPVVIFSVNGNIIFLKNKPRLRGKISWNKSRSKVKSKPKNNNVDYLIDPTYRNINTLLVCSFKNGNDNPSRNYFNEYYMPLVEMKNFNALIDYKPF